MEDFVVFMKLHLCMHGELLYHHELNTLCCIACGLTQQTYNSVWTEQTKRAFDNKLIRIPTVLGDTNIGSINRD